ncbi:MAG: O-methyltransferase [Bacteroidota bacterium]
MPSWTDVDAYVSSLFTPDVSAHERILRQSTAAGLPEISVSSNQGRMLELVARMCGAKRILEIGTLGGYSTLWLAQALPADGRIVTLELEPHHAATARHNLDEAGVGERVEIMVGPGTDSLDTLAKQGAAPFDFVFIDADKPGYPAYLAGVLPLTRPGTVIVADNVVRNGEVANAESDSEKVQGVRHFLRDLAAVAGAEATVIQTVGDKGYDGFALAVLGR